MATLSTYALTSLADCKAFLDIESSDTSRDDLITTLINAATKEIETYCGRRFASRTYRQYFTLDGETLILPNYPVTRIYRVALGRVPAIEVTYSGAYSNPNVTVTPVANDTTAAPDYECNQVILTDDDDETAINANASTLSTVRASIALVSGWSATLVYTDGVAGAHAASDLIPTVEAATERTVTLEIPAVAFHDYRIDMPTGMLRFGAAYNGEWNDVRVDYVAGWSSVQTADETADLAQACRQLVQAALLNIGDAAGVKSESLGDFSQSFGEINRSELLRTLLAGYADWSRLGVTR